MPTTRDYYETIGVERADDAERPRHTSRVGAVKGRCYE